MAADDPVGPYLATVAAARGLALDIAAEGERPSQRAPRVTDDQVTDWLVEGSAKVGARIVTGRLLPLDDAGAEGIGHPGILTQEQVTLIARNLVQLWAASLYADVTHPERVRDGVGYGQSLLNRYTSGLNELAAAIDQSVGVVGGDDPETPGLGLAYSFPEATPWRAVQF